jgi:hypothetical protein
MEHNSGFYLLEIIDTLATGPDGWGSIPGWARDFSFFHSVQTSSGAHTVSYPMGNQSYFPGIKATEV